MIEVLVTLLILIIDNGLDYNYDRFETNQILYILLQVFNLRPSIQASNSRSSIFACNPWPFVKVLELHNLKS